MPADAPQWEQAISGGDCRSVALFSDVGAIRGH
jgi:hypothetical protein